MLKVIAIFFTITVALNAGDHFNNLKSLKVGHYDYTLTLPSKTNIHIDEKSIEPFVKLLNLAQLDKRANRPFFEKKQMGTLTRGEQQYILSYGFSEKKDSPYMITLTPLLGKEGAVSEYYTLTREQGELFEKTLIQKFKENSDFKPSIKTITITDLEYEPRSTQSATLWRIKLTQPQVQFTERLIKESTHIDESELRHIYFRHTLIARITTNKGMYEMAIGVESPSIRADDHNEDEQVKEVFYISLYPLGMPYQRKVKHFFLPLEKGKTLYRSLIPMILKHRKRTPSEKVHNDKYIPFPLYVFYSLHPFYEAIDEKMSILEFGKDARGNKVKKIDPEYLILQIENHMKALKVLDTENYFASHYLRYEKKLKALTKKN